MARVVITGIGGFIGAQLAQRLVDGGHLVRGLEASSGAVERMQLRGFHVLHGDVTDADAVATATQHADVVIHTAAVVEEDGDRKRFEHVNVEGTRTVALGARANGVKRFVHLSSVMVYGFRYADGVTETGALAGDGNIYNETKIASEAIVRELHDGDAFGVIVIRPGDVYGARGAQWVLRPLDLLRRGWFALPDRGSGAINHVHVDNLVDAIVLALEHDAIGEIFNVTDGTATACRDFFAYHAAIARAPLRTLPAWAMRAGVTALETTARVTRRTPLVRAASVDFLLRRGRYATLKAETLLGYAPRISLAEGMRGVAQALAAR